MENTLCVITSDKYWVLNTLPELYQIDKQYKKNIEY